VSGPFDLSSRVALVTGAGQNIGAGIALALAGRGAAVAVNDLDEDRAADTAHAITAAGGTALAVPFDVTDPDAVGHGVASAAAELGGPVDILVNNAGVPVGMSVGPFRTLPREEWARFIDLNVYGSLNCIAAVLDPMVERRWGRIIQISSGAGRTGLRMGVSLYGASKSGIEGFIRHLSQEMARSGVTANAIALGLMQSTRNRTDDDATHAIERQIPLGRLGSPTDVGWLTVYLASAEAEWMTGQTLDLNGGQTTN
jgi:NAD(P)-dependent dehydrogenase (short-subunit alcohol dehydrogenase family)